MMNKKVFFKTLVIFPFLIQAMREVPSLYGQVLAHVLKNKWKYEKRLDILPIDIQETVNNLPQQPGYLYATRGFAEEYIQENLKLEDKMRGVWRAIDLAFYQSMVRKTQFKDYAFSQETIELAEKLEKNWSNLENLGNNSSYETYEKLDVLKSVVKSLQEHNCLNERTAELVFGYNLTEALIYITSLLQRKKLRFELWDKAAWKGHIPTLELLLKHAAININQHNIRGKQL